MSHNHYQVLGIGLGASFEQIRSAYGLALQDFRARANTEKAPHPAAIDALSTSSHGGGWERIHARLGAHNECPQVAEAAIRYVVAHCRADAVDALLRLVVLATPSNALTDDLNNAARAIEALRALGTSEANAAVEQLRNTQGVPPTLKMALEQPLPEDGGCVSSGR